jgi:hypothetical protein
MKLLINNERVRLEVDLPERRLHRGAVGVICSTWFAPNTTYEVEFPAEEAEPDENCRVLLRPGQISPAGDDR